MLTYFNTEGTILEYTNDTNKKVVNYAQPLDISLTKTEDDSCICSGTKTLNLTATLNTTGQTNIYYQWYYNSVLLTGYTASAITYATQPNSNIYCKIYSKLGEGNSNIITTAKCTSYSITGKHPNYTSPVSAKWYGMKDGGNFVYLDVWSTTLRWDPLYTSYVGVYANNQNDPNYCNDASQVIYTYK